MLKTKKQIIWISSLSLLLVGVIDYFLTFEIRTLILYLIPIFLFSYQNKISQKYLIVFASIAATMWVVLEYITHPYSNNQYIIFNAVSRFAIFYPGFYYP